MSDCISLISTDAKLSDIASWVNVSQMTHVLHTECIKIRSAASGYLDIEPFLVSDMDCRIVGAIIYHCCNRGAIHSWTDERISHITQNGGDIIVKPSCWELNPQKQSQEADICWISDPCKRLEALRCCEWEWLKQGKKKDWSFRDSSGSISYLSESRLKELISEAEMQCDQRTCQNSRCITFNCNNGYC